MGIYFRKDLQAFLAFAKQRLASGAVLALRAPEEAAYEGMMAELAVRYGVGLQVRGNLKNRTAI